MSAIEFGFGQAIGMEIGAFVFMLFLAVVCAIIAAAVGLLKGAWFLLCCGYQWLLERRQERSGPRTGP